MTTNERDVFFSEFIASESLKWIWLVKVSNVRVE